MFDLAHDHRLGRPWARSVSSQTLDTGSEVTYLIKWKNWKRMRLGGIPSISTNKLFDFEHDHDLGHDQYHH